MAWFGGKPGNARDVKKPSDFVNMGGADGKGRKMGPNSVIEGTAIAREDLAASQLGATAPPPTAAENASAGAGSARSAAERQRKRAAAGSTLATAKMKPGGPGVRLSPRSLIGF